MCLYVVQTASDTVTTGSGEATRTEILDWCLTHQFELVQCDDTEDEDDFDEREGKERVVSALKAHTWSNLILAGDLPASQQPNIPASDSNKDNDGDNNIGSILESLTVEDGDDINFEDLFSQLNKMKEVSKNLPEHERKAYAEMVK